eukprot:m.7140 g.7140  ORF g.7140 m.7140 type:complete len:55 (-) comp8722_c0_seq1:31-195(-)
MCLLPPFSNVVNTCSLRTVIGALGICTAMMVWVATAYSQLPTSSTQKSLTKKKQ